MKPTNFENDRKKCSYTYKELQYIFLCLNYMAHEKGNLSMTEAHKLFKIIDGGLQIIAADEEMAKALIETGEHISLLSK